ncbi:MAG: hypothetical protein UX30_C0004G0040 [Candidatus Saccharibacteria bacterium GW2011_GWA2_46_10]|nr:MAG: hypothetical protein UX30_C0004G0040 [Candidatus Saccharibacteria bacterium GW2011_GWA2_46_10]
MFRSTLFAFALLVTTAASAAVERVQSPPKQVIIVVTYYKSGGVSIILPPSLDFEVEGRHLHHMEVEEFETHLDLNANSVEIYAVRKGAKIPTTVVIQDMQLGPGFIIDPAWKVVLVRK